MTWVLVIGLALLVLAFVLVVFKVKAGGREAIICVLALGLAGYAIQGSPSLSGAPKIAENDSKDSAAILVEARSKITNSGIPTLNRWIVISDGLARHGRYGEAAEVLRGAIAADPKDSESWLAMANALLGHADGALTPASLYAYRQAAVANPNAPGPPFFLGLALAQEGRLTETRVLWADLLRKAPEDAQWRLPIAQQLMRIDTILAAQKHESVTMDAPVNQKEVPSE